ncbi:MAG: hypothetical protein R2704_18450 [Microthrixaceae bacterium]
MTTSGRPSSDAGLDGLLKSIVAGGIVLTLALGIAVFRSVDVYSAGVDRARGEAIESGRDLDHPGIAGADEWRITGPGDWVSESDGRLRLTDGRIDRSTFVVTRLPQNWDHEYRLAFTVVQSQSASGVVLAAVDDDNYFELRDVSPWNSWAFGEVVAGERTVRQASGQGDGFATGDRVEVLLDNAELVMTVNGEMAASIGVDTPADEVWVGFFGYEPGFAVSDVELTEP